MSNNYDEMLPLDWDIFKPGDRVVTTAPVLDYPLKPIPPGQTGTVLYSRDDIGIAVRLDAHFPDLDEWDNCAYVCCDVRHAEACGGPPLRLKTDEDPTTWTQPNAPGHEVNLQEVSDRVLRAMLDVATNAGKVQELASHFKALGLKGPYDLLYCIASDLEDTSDALNTLRVGYIGAAFCNEEDE
jgi:hypothetical protein